MNVQPVPMLADNYAWLIRDRSGVALVDPPDAAAGVAAVEAAGGRLDAVLLTHHHWDHTGGAEALRDRYGARLVGAAADAHRLPRLDQAVVEGDLVRVGGLEGVVLETPGHTRGHISYFFGGLPALFCGDTLFSLGCGKLLEGDADEMFSSLAKFARLPGETLVCCGHEYTASNARFAVTVEPDNEALRARAAEVFGLRARGVFTVPSRLDAEREANPFMRAPTAERLGEIRAAKDVFR